MQADSKATRERVLVIAPSSSAAGFFDPATELGMDVTVASYAFGDGRAPNGQDGRAWEVVFLDGADEQAAERKIRDMHAERPFAAVVPGFEFFVPQSARFSALLGLPGLAPLAAKRSRDKALMREAVGAAGVRVPRYTRVTSASDLPAAARHAGFPCVLKPTLGAGSVHVQRVESRAELEAAYRQVLDDRWFTRNPVTSAQMLVEEWVAGPEYSVEGYVREGRAEITAVTTKFTGPLPFFVELGHVVPADIDAVHAAAVAEYVRDVVAAVGITIGVFHCEVRLSAEGPVLMEIAARLAGDRISELVELTTGVSLPRVMLELYMGREPSPPSIAKRRANAAGIRFFTAPGRSSYEQVHGLEELAKEKDVLAVGTEIDPGQEIQPAEDFRCRVAYAIFTADSPAAASQRWHALDGAVSFL